MTGHNPSQSGMDHLLKRVKCNTVQTGTVKIQHRQRLMRIHFRISMSRKMLGYRKYSSILQSTRICNHFLSNVFRITAKRASIDDRVARINIHIGNRSKINLYTYFFALTGNFLTIFIKQLIILNTAQYPVAGKTGSILQPHRQSPFAVKSNKQRYFR